MTPTKPLEGEEPSESREKLLPRPLDDYTIEECVNWLRRQANAEREPKARAALIEAHNAIHSLIPTLGR